jgi:hypothetical protein
MLIKRQPFSFSPRAGVIGLVAAIAVTLAGAPVGLALPADAEPPETSESAIGAGGASDLEEYRRSLLPADGDGDGEVEIEEPVILGDNVCQPLTGVVSQADIDEALRGDPAPIDPGVWQYEVCAEDAARARAIAARYPTAAAAKQYCGPPYDGADICGVYVRWRSEITSPPPADPGDRQDYLDSLFDFAPNLKTSPALDEQHGVIANLPTWFWNTVLTELPKAVPGAGNAWHLWTTFRVNDLQVCRVAGLHKVGTRYVAGQDAPDKPSPSNCGYTFPNQGRYVVRGCSRWLFIIGGGLLPPLIFAETFCSDDLVPVKEAQVLTGGDAHRRRVN